MTATRSLRCPADHAHTDPANSDTTSRRFRARVGLAILTEGLVVVGTN